MKITSYAKWILTGEHAVIRGAKAIVFPFKNYKSSLKFIPGDCMQILDKRVENSHQIIDSLIDIASSFTGILKEKFYGLIKIESSIPIGKGLGSSAALCANITKLSEFLGYQGDLLLLGRYLENKFHKNSSGLDIAASIYNKSIIFQNNKIKEFLNLKNLPHLTLTYCGKTSLTSICVEKIDKLFRSDENKAISLDEDMNTSAELCEKGLQEENLSLLADGINLGNEVFKAWELYNDELKTVADFLRKKGVVAFKPTGSGLGGYVVGLWDHKPSADTYDIYLTLESC